MALKEARETVAAVLAAEGFHTSPHPPESIRPPMAYIQAASPYVTSEGQRFGRMKANLEVRLVPRPGTSNATITDALDKDIENALVALHNADLSVSEVSLPYSLVTDGGTYTAVSITVSTTFTL